MNNKAVVKVIGKQGRGAIYTVLSSELKPILTTTPEPESSIFNCPSCNLGYPNYRQGVECPACSFKEGFSFREFLKS